MAPLPSATPPATRAPGALVALVTFVAYVAVAAAALLLAGPPGYAAPLYPSAGIALAATVVYGRAALPGVFLGALAVNAGLSVLRGDPLVAALPMLALIGGGAGLQAAVGGWLLRRHVVQPMALNAPRDVARAGLLGAPLACLVSPTVATAALGMAGVLGGTAWLGNWATWWLGDTLGVLIGAPLSLVVIGRPRADWRPRLRTVGVPLLLALGLVAAGMAELDRRDASTRRSAFERDADRLAHTVKERLDAPLFALQALHGAARARGGVDQAMLHDVSPWWLAQPMQLQALGHSVRLPLAAIADFEAAARAQGLAGYRVFDRDEGRARAADGEVVALRHIEPLAGNDSALGVNALSIPAARAAILATRRSGEPAATAGFPLTQGGGADTGLVLYQALYEGQPATAAERESAFRGVVFVTVNAQRSLVSLPEPALRYLRWCLVDASAGAARPRLAGPAGCETAAALPYQLQRELQLGGRPLVLRVGATAGSVPGAGNEASWLLSVVGLAAASMLGALLLTVTGHSRLTQLAVQSATAELRHEMAERTQAEAALRASEARLRSILDHAPLGVMFMDPRGVVIDCNPRLAEMVGVSRDALCGQPGSQLVQPEEIPQLQQLRRSLLTGAEVGSVGPLRLAPAAGEGRQVRVSASALRDAQGRVERIVGVVEDVTEVLRLAASEKALHRAEEANRAKSEFLSRMSHELRTPLNAMIGFSQLLEMEREPALAEHQRGWVQQILRAGWHLLEMINETLDLARIESGSVPLKLEPVELAPMCAACRAMVAVTAAQRGVTVSERLDPRAAAVLGDPTRVKQVLTNLLSNAVKYNRNGGSVVIASRINDDGTVAIEVVDDGLGMTPEQLGSLFQPYNRLGRESSGIEGTGIGLVISRRLAELMGGTVSVRSVAGRGSTFTVALPAAPVAAVRATAAGADSQAPYQQRLVHYVEDNETNVEVMRGVLAQRGQIVLESSSLGLDGLASMRRRRPDLVLLDMQLPDISGLELLRHLKQDAELTDIPVVVVSADANPAHMQQALTLGAQHYVTKPVDVQGFLKVVDGILEQAETRFGA